VKSHRAGEWVMAGVKRFLERRLKLAVNQEKSKVASTNKITFLGFTFKGTSIRWSDKAFAEFKRRVRKLTGRSWGVPMPYRYKKLVEYLRGWMGYYGISEYYRPIPIIDHWLRRRMRMCYWKQWRWCRTKVRELTKLGTRLHTAISVGLSRKSYWRLSRTLATQSGMITPWRDLRIRVCCLSKNCGLTFITLLRHGSSWEPPSADPHARWCGGRGRKTPGYPIRQSFY